MAKKSKGIACLADERAVHAAAREVDGAVHLTLTIKPGQKRELLENAPADGLLLRVAAPPVDGKANARVIELLAGQLGVPKSAVVLVRGSTSRLKTIAISGLSAAAVVARLLGGPAAT